MTMDALARHRLLRLAGVSVAAMRVPPRAEVRADPPDDVDYEDDDSDEDLAEDDETNDETNDDEDQDFDDEGEDESSGLARHRLLQLVGIEARARSNPTPGRQVITREGAQKYGLPIGATILPGMRALTAAQRQVVADLPEQDRARYLAARRQGSTHAAAMKAAGGSARAKAAKEAAPRKANPIPGGTLARRKRMAEMLATIDRGDYPGRGLRDVEDLDALKSARLIEEHAGAPHGWRLTDRGHAALARERGVTIPAGAKKADIVRLLDETPTPSAAPLTPAQFEARAAAASQGEDALTAPPWRMMAKNRPPAGHDRDVYDAVRSYSRGGSNKIGRLLRGRDVEDAATVRTTISGIDEAMASSRLDREIVVWRGQQSADAIGPSARASDLTGFEWTDPAFLGTTAKHGKALEFAADKDSVVMRILAPRDTPALQLTSMEHEAEVLLGRGLRYRVVRDRGVVDGRRTVDVEILPTQATRAVAKKAAVPPSPLARQPVAAATKRQSTIDTRRAAGDLLADTLERLAAEVDTPVLVRGIEQAARRLGVSKRTTDTLLTAARTGDRAQIEAVVTRLARTGKIRLDPTPEIGVFDRATMQGLGDIRAGAKVRIIRPGVVTDVGGQTVRLSKSVVEELTAAEVRTIERRIQREATRIRFEQVQQATGTSRLLAEVDELLANKATARTIRERLDEAFLAPEQLFANADPAVMRALLEVADDPVKLRAAVTRLGTKAKIKPVSRSGAKVAFDPDTMESVGTEIAKGTRVTVVRRGASVTLPDGSRVQLAKAQVTPVVKAVKPGGRPPARVTPIHDLIDAPDAEIERALRDVYEGKFGPFTTKVEIGITRAGTRTSKTGRVTKVDPSVHIEGKIYDASGHQIGDFGRSIGPVTLHYGSTVRREVWADHAIVQLDPKFQGKGFGGEFNRRAIEWYRASGVHGISLSDHNGYVWASQGFDWGARGMAATTVDDMRDLIAAIRAGATKDKYGVAIPKALREAKDLDAQLAAADDVLERVTRLNPGDPGYPTAREVSQIGRTTQKGKTSTWFGKYFMFNNGSTSELILNPAEGIVLS